ncbi:hypothetical protein [Algihabitans albus]|uniref:hypothetical protein n=1 Tax=Algihabitans albus TaxID=2164067 RepID=UPI0013C36B22|nr:hypothetical protein [Algihabitans albus]
MKQDAEIVPTNSAYMAIVLGFGTLFSGLLMVFVVPCLLVLHWELLGTSRTADAVS